jgi:virulence-associated protein VapD
MPLSNIVFDFKEKCSADQFDDHLRKSFDALKELSDTSTLFDVPIDHELFDIINKCQRYHNLRVNGLQSPMTHAHVRMLGAIAFDFKVDVHNSMVILQSVPNAYRSWKQCLEK